MPELMKPPATPYLTVIPGRIPEQKVHKRLGDAKNAFDTPRQNMKIRSEFAPGKFFSRYSHGWGQLYEMIDGHWELLYDVEQPSERHEKYPYYVDTRPWKQEG